MAWPGMAWRGRARQGLFGAMVAVTRNIMARFGMARIGTAWRGEARARNGKIVLTQAR